MPKSRKKYIVTLIASAALLLVLLLVTGSLSRNIGSDTVSGGEHPLRISEIMSSNTAYPNADGLCCDWIEIENTSAHDFNVSGYRLTDDVTEARFAFPTGTVIPAGGYVVVYCSAECSGGLYASFGLNRRGGETIQLMNSANIVLDEVENLGGPKNSALIREPDGSFSITATPTPGFANTEEGYAAYLASCGQGMGNLRISEVMTASKLYTAPNGESCDWIEIVNTGSETVDLSGMHLSDKEGEFRYTFAEGTLLAPDTYLVVWCSGTEGEGYAAFRLNRSGETVILTDAQGNSLDRVHLPYLPNDTSYARLSGGWSTTAEATPGYANTEAGYAAWVSAMGYDHLTVSFTEICTKNISGLRDRDGDATDWVELYNSGTETVSLLGWYLSDDPADPIRWKLGDVSLSPGEYLVIRCSGKDQKEGQLHTDFSLSTGETVVLTTPIGTTADSVECPMLEEDQSLELLNGEWVTTDAPTPGAANR